MSTGLHHVHATGGAGEEFVRDERIQHKTARVFVQSEQTPRLCARQTQARHIEKFAPDPAEKLLIVVQPSRVAHHDLRIACARSGRHCPLVQYDMRAVANLVALAARRYEIIVRSDMRQRGADQRIPGGRERIRTSRKSEPSEHDRTHVVIRVVDDDATMLRSMALLLEAAGYRVKTYDGAEAFLGDRDPSPGCAVLDLHMTGAGGLELQQSILETDNPLAVIFLTGRGDVRSSVRAMKRGAVDFLTKPVSGEDLLDAVRRAIALDHTARRERRARAQLRARYEALTARERQVFGLVAQGLLNKQVAAALGTSERTIKAHRANVMRKMGAESVADLARAAERLAVPTSAGE